MAKFVQEEHKIREANLRLQRKLQLEMERREQLCRHLSESESSLEMDDERSVQIDSFVIFRVSFLFMSGSLILLEKVWLWNVEILLQTLQ